MKSLLMVLMKKIGNVKSLPFPTLSIKMTRVILPTPMHLVQLLEEMMGIITSLEPLILLVLTLKHLEMGTKVDIKDIVRVMMFLKYPFPFLKKREIPSLIFIRNDNLILFSRVMI